MTTTGIFTLHKYEIQFEKCGEPVYLIPFGDVHRSSPMCNEEKWLEFCEWASEKGKAYFIGMGDYDDLASTSERRILRNDGLHESTLDTLEAVYSRHTDRLAGEISFMKGRTIGLIEGNHYGSYQNGTTTTQRLASSLGCRYLGVCSIIRLYFTDSSGITRGVVDVVAHHGKGAARLVGGSMNRVQQMVEAADANIYLMGHDHKKSVGMTTRLKIGDGRSDADEGIHLIHTKQIFCRTGSFLNSYEDEKRSYVVDAMMSPTDLGVVKIELTPKSTKTGRRYIDIHASI